MTIIHAQGNETLQSPLKIIKELVPRLPTAPNKQTNIIRKENVGKSKTGGMIPLSQSVSFPINDVHVEECHCNILFPVYIGIKIAFAIDGDVCRQAATVMRSRKSCFSFTYFHCLP